MATNKGPKHDFAPAWLKIPDQDAKSSGPKQNDYDRGPPRNSRREDYYNGYNYPHCHDYPYHGGHPLQRQRSFDYYEDRRFPPQKFRHHSVDDDFYSPYGGYPPYYNGYNYEKFNTHYRSQPQLYREGKYQHPNARYSQVGGMYPPPPPPPFPFDPYYEYYGAEYYPPPPGYMRGPPGGPPGGPGGKRFPYDPRFNGRPSDKDGRFSDTNGSRKASLEDDFPSLNGDSAAHDKDRSMSRGVWDSQSKDVGRPGYKVMTVNKNKAKEDSTKKQPLQTCENINNNGPSKDATPVQIPSSNSPSDKTSLNEGDSSKNNNKHEEDVNKVVNGIEEIHVSPVEEKLLSSSLEAEQRLLREMGWNETDEEEYEITEDDMKEFYNLSKQVMMKEKKNGLTRTLPKTWSPQHVSAPFQPPSQAELNEASSNESESDMD